MTGATLARPPVRHQEGKLPMLDQSPIFGDPRLPARFWVKVRAGSIPAHRPDLGPCWVWTGSRNRNGYGQFWHGRHMGAHRFAYEALVGSMPDGLQSDHLCRNRSCIRPDHLEPVTGSVNLKRSPLVGRYPSERRSGEANGRAKLTKEQVREIRRLRGAITQDQLAASFGVGQAAISNIQRRHTWQTVDEYRRSAPKRPRLELKRKEEPQCPSVD